MGNRGLLNVTTLFQYKIKLNEHFFLLQWGRTQPLTYVVCPARERTPPNWSNPLEETSSSSRKKGQINSPSGALTARAIHGSFHCFFLTSSSRSTGVTVQNNAKSEDAKKLTATIDANAASQPPFPFKKNPTICGPKNEAHVPSVFP